MYLYMCMYTYVYMYMYLHTYMYMYTCMYMYMKLGIWKRSVAVLSAQALSADSAPHLLRASLSLLVPGSHCSRLPLERDHGV